VLIRSISTKVCEKYQETPQDCVFFPEIASKHTWMTRCWGDSTKANYKWWYYWE
jgi:hypothetical protein